MLTQALSTVILPPDCGSQISLSVGETLQDSSYNSYSPTTPHRGEVQAFLHRYPPPSFSFFSPDFSMSLKFLFRAPTPWGLVRWIGMKTSHKMLSLPNAHHPLIYNYHLNLEP